jgi:CBS domain-containing protein
MPPRTSGTFDISDIFVFAEGAEPLAPGEGADDLDLASRSQEGELVMKCSEVMKGNTECCSIGESVSRIAERMRDRNIGFVPVCNEAGEVVGTLTDRDLALRVLADRLVPEDTMAGDIMTAGVIGCSPDDELQTAEMLMSKHKISRIVCLDADQRPVGVISLSDVAQRERGGKASALLRSVAQREARP